MLLEILDEAGAVINRIEADAAFAETYYPGHWRPGPARPPAPRKRQLTALEFLRRFSAEQRMAIMGLAKTDPQCEDYLYIFQLGLTQDALVNLDDPDVITAIDYFATQLSAAEIDPAVILA